MKKLLLGAMSLTMLFLLTNCKKEVINKEAQSFFSGGEDPEDCPTIVKTFYAGQHINAGTIYTYNDQSHLYIIFAMSNNWVMGMTHIYVGSKESMPQTKKGNPKIGNFPYKISHDPMTKHYVFKLPLDEIDLNCFIVAAHAEVHHLNNNGEIDQSETAWADGEQITDKGSWAMYYDYCECYAY